MNLSFQPAPPYVPCNHARDPKDQRPPLDVLYYARYRQDGRCKLPDGVPGEAWRDLDRNPWQEFPGSSYTWVPYQATCAHCQKVVWKREEPWS